MSRSARRSATFYLIAVLLPFVLLFLAEMALRAFDYGHEYPLFVDVPGQPGMIQPNDEVIKRFFALPQMAPKVSPDTHYFPKEKGAGTLRIIVQGGSTAAGFPFGRWGSLSGMLQQRFKRLYPERDIEVINTAMSSVNSYTLLDFADEILAVEPDIILIYAGHNEYLGVLGVGSALASKGGRAATLLHLKLKSLKIYNLLESSFYSLFVPEADPADERTLMAKVAREKDIPLGSSLYHAGIAQFEGNMSLLLDIYQQAGKPVVLGNLVSNEKDLIPFSAIDDIKESDLESWLALKSDERELRIEQLAKETASSSANAAAHYELAYLLHSDGAAQRAKEHFILARDLDTLRFRAPSEFNNVLSSLSKRDDVFLADVDAVIRADSADGLIGSEHMLEHLHPTARGYFLLADAFLQSLLSQKLLSEAWPDDIGLAWEEMPITLADAMYAQFKIDRLMADYPFTTEKKMVIMPARGTLESDALHDRVEGKDWLRINRELSPRYQRVKNVKEASKIAGLLADALPDNYNLTFIAGLLYHEALNPQLGLYYLHKGMRMRPESIPNRLSLAQLYYLLGKTSESLKHLDFVKQKQPNHPQVDAYIARVKAARKGL